MSSKRSPSPGQRAVSVRPSSLAVSASKAAKNQIQAADEQQNHCASGKAKVYLTRPEVAERYPISIHTLAKLASQGKGPRYFKPTDKCLYRPEDIEAWIEAAAVLPSAVVTKDAGTVQLTGPGSARNGRGRTKPAPTPPAKRQNGRKSLPPSPNSWLRRTD